MTPADKRTRSFADLTPSEAFNVGRVVGLLNENVQVKLLPGGLVTIATKFGRPLTMEELLEHASRLSNTL